MKVKIIGVGGIGTHIVGPLCLYLDSLNKDVYLTLVDGDSFGMKNRPRQYFDRYGNKAEVTAARLRRDFRCMAIEAKTVYLSDENIFAFVREGDIVFSCVDNHSTRKLLSEHCGTLENVTLISGGNEYTDGNIQIYLRRDGVNMTPPLTHLHPEIAFPKDRNPSEMSCEELSQNGAPQLIFTNLMAATLMLSAFWGVTSQDMKYTEQYFDLLTGAVRPVKRQEK